MTDPDPWIDDTANPVAAWARQIADAPDTAGCIPGPPPITAAAGPPQVDTTTGEPHTGAMIALVPERPEAWALDGWEPPDALHLTLGFLGEADLIPPPALQALQGATADLAAGMPPVDANVFGVSVWNATGDTPSLNLSVGGDGLAPLHERVWELVARAGVAGGPEALWSPPANHTPWVAHVCLAYGDPAAGLEPFMAAGPLASQLEGPIRFDRIRLAVGGESTDYMLGAPTEPAAPPDGSMASTPVIVATNLEEHTMAVPPVEPNPDGSCPPDHHPDDDGMCVPDDAVGDVAAQAPAVAPTAEPGEHLRSKMHTQGSSTGDGETGRMFTNTTYRATPFAFHWAKASSAHGGMPVVVHVGNVVRVVPAAGPGQPDYGFVQLDLESADGWEYARRSVAGFERWGSIGLDETKPTVTMTWPEPDEDEDEDPLAGMLAEPDLVTVDGGRVGELTGVSVPAQADADIEPTEELIRLVLGDTPAPAPDDDEEDEDVPAKLPARPAAADDAVAMADTVQALTAAAYTITIPDLAPAWWFNEPVDVDLSEGAFNLTEDGRIYGAVAPLGVNHRAFAKAGRRQEVPVDRVDYDRFMGGWAITSAGKVHAGPVTMDCGHAARFRANGDVAPAHYENSCTVVAKIAVGYSRQRRIVWAAGALEPGVTIDQVSRMLACRLSGDWQPHSDRPGWTELVATLLVPSPGFPMAHGGASVTYEGEALVASSVPVRAVGSTGRPRLRVNLAAGTVERVATHTPAEQFRRVVSDVRAGRPVTRTKRGCC